MTRNIFFLPYMLEVLSTSLYSVFFCLFFLSQDVYCDLVEASAMSQVVRKAIVRYKGVLIGSL